MMKRLLLAAFLLLPGVAEAANCNSNPFTLTNGQTADATQVQANFNNLLNCANNNLAHNGANSDITSISGLTTPLSVVQGGTGVAAFPATAGLLVGNGTATLTSIAPATAGNLLVSNGVAWVPSTAFSGGTVNGPLTLNGTLTMAGAALNEAYATSSATPVAGIIDISGIGANFIDLSGTAMGAITGFGALPAGAERTIRFTGAAPGTLTNSGQLILPLNLSITIGQLDVLKIRSFGSGTSELVSYVPNIGAAIYGPASKATQQAATDATQFVTPAQQQQHPSATKAYGIVASSGSAVVGSYPSSATSVKNSTGNYTVTFGQTMANTNYIVLLTVEASNEGAIIVSRTTTTFTLALTNFSGGASDQNVDYAVLGGLN